MHRSPLTTTSVRGKKDVARKVLLQEPEKKGSIAATASDSGAGSPATREGGRLGNRGRARSPQNEPTRAEPQDWLSHARNAGGTRAAGFHQKRGGRPVGEEALEEADLEDRFCKTHSDSRMIFHGILLSEQQ
jgi:hypothetical protein